MDPAPVTQDLTIRDYLRVLFRQKAIIFTAFITVMVTVAIGLQFKTPVYEATVKMLISGEKQVESPYYRDLVTGFRNVEVTLTQSEIVKSNPVMELSTRALGLSQKPLDYEARFSSRLKRPFIRYMMRQTEKKFAGAPADALKSYLFQNAVLGLKEQVKVEPIRDTNMFTISIKDYSPLGAAVIANVVSRAYIIFDLEQQIAELQLRYGDKHSTVLQLKDNIEKMMKSLNGEPLPNVEAIGPASIKIIEQAQIPFKPTGIPKVMTLILAFFMAIFLGVMLAFTFEYMDQSFKAPRDIEVNLNIPFLGAIPRVRIWKSRMLPADKKIKGAFVHAYQNLSEQVFLLMKDKKLKTVLFVSAVPHEHASSVVTNLGIALGKYEGNKILVIDANLRNPSIHKKFKISEGPGLAEILEGKATIEKSTHHIDGSVNVITSGKTELNPITLLGSSRMHEVILHAKGTYDVVFIDCPELKSYKDASVLASLTDAMILIITEGKTRRQVVKAMLQPLVDKKFLVLGAILNDRTYSIPKMIYDRV